MRVLVLGLGSAGTRHANVARRLGHTVHAFDPDESRSARPPAGVASHKTESQAWDSNPEAVIIATPAPLHMLALREARSRNCRVLVEKPLAVSAADAVAMVPAPAGRVERVAYNLRFHAGLRTFRDRLPAAPRSARLEIKCDKSSWPGRMYEDMLLEGSHEIDLALWMLGPARVAGAVGSGDRWTLLLSHLSGCVTTVLLDGTQAGTYERTFEVESASDVVRHEFGPDGNGWRVSQRGARASESSEFRGSQRLAGTYYDEVEDFLGAHGPTQCASLEEGLNVLQVCDAARAHARAANRLARGAGAWRC